LLTPTTEGGGGAGEGFDVKKGGDAHVFQVGFSSVGKSMLLNKLRGSFTEVCSCCLIRLLALSWTTVLASVLI
jgi:ribosome-interacting GTPase 1